MQVLGKMPLDPAYAELADAGLFYKADNPYLEDAVKKIENMQDYSVKSTEQSV